MSKKMLRTIAQKIEDQIELFNKNHEIQVTYGGTRVTKLKTEEQEAYRKVVESGDMQKAAEMLGAIDSITPSKLYLEMPDLEVSDNGSIQSLSVYVYSAKANDEVLLHKLFSKVRELT